MDEAPGVVEGLIASPPRRGRLLAAALALSLSLPVACSTSAGEVEPVASCSMAPALASPPDLPADFPQPEGVSLTEVRVKEKFVSTEGYDRRSVEELFEDVRPLLTDRGFDVINTDFEGFEAELYFAKGDGLAGIVAMREGPCDGYVKVNVLYDPLETAAGQKAVRKTRRLSGEG